MCLRIAISLTLNASYVTATSWPDLVKAIRFTGTKEKGTSEELIHLRLASKVDGVPNELRGTRSIVYKKVTDIPALLRGEKIPLSELNPDAPTFVPSQVSTRPSAHEAERPLDAAEEMELGMAAPPDEEDAGLDHLVDLEAAVQAVDEGREEQTAVPPTTEEIAAARYLANLYHRRLSHRRGYPKKGLGADRNRYFLACMDAAAARKTKKPYGLLYLGPLPHVLVCLDTINSHVLASKKKAMLKRDLVPHSKYEVVMAQIDHAM